MTTSLLFRGRALLGSVLMLLCLGVGAWGINPDTPFPQYVKTVWGPREGLYQSVVQIVQTRDGYLWAATQDGLARFDGMQLTVFDTHNTPAIKHNQIRSLFEDRSGTLWIGTFGGGVTSYKSGQFRSYNVKDGLSSNFILSIAQDKQGAIWAGTPKGLNRLQGEKFVPSASETSASEAVTALLTDKKGVVWFGSTEHFGYLQDQAAVNKHTTDRVTAMYFDHEDGLWVATAASGVQRFVDGKYIHYGPEDGLPQATVITMFQDRSETMWLGTEGGGLCRRLDGRFQCYTSKDGVPDNFITSIYEDEEGNLWLGTRNAGMIRVKDSSFLTYSEDIGVQRVRSVYQARAGFILVGADPGLYRLDRQRNDSFKVTDLHVNAGVLSIFEDRAGTLWLGTRMGLKEYKNGRIKSYTIKDGLPENSVYAVFGDSFGDLWIGSRDGGLTRLHDGKFQSFTEKDGLASNRIRFIFQDHEGALWFCAIEGVARYVHGQFTNYNIQVEGSGTGGGLHIHEDSDHVLWMGSYGSGLSRFANGKFTTYTTKDGLFDDIVYNILEDEKGYLWMTSNRGLFRVRRDELNDFAAGKISRVHSTAYGLSDGLKNADFSGGNQNNAWKTQDGKFLYTNTAGLLVVDPAHVHTNPLPPRVLIESVCVNDNAGLVTGASVPVGQGELEFGFTAFSYQAPEKIQFKYMMEGFDKDWITPGKRRTAYYTNIPPGNYRFRVIASNNDGVWNASGASFDLHLRPRFYQSAWFYLVAALVLVGGTAGAYWLRLRHIKKTGQRLLQLVDERTTALQQEVVEHKKTEVALILSKESAEAATRAKSEFLANMSHEIRTPLNGVLGMLDLARQTTHVKEQEEFLGLAKESASALLGVINDVLDFSKIEAGKMELDAYNFTLADLVADTARMLALRAHQKKLELVCRIAPNCPTHLLGDATRLQQVLLNLIGNAIKFTSEGEVVVWVQPERLEGEDVQLQFSVSDTGIGIAHDKQKLIFEAFAQADASTTRKFGGSGLGLAICSRIVSLMGGRIWVESALGVGSTFSFTAGFKAVSESENAALTASPADLRDLPVLIVDDNRTNRRILEEILSGAEMRPTSVDSGAAALQAMVRAAQRNQPFPLVLVDFQMPGMDGLQLVEHVRSHAELSACTIIMLTSDNFTVDARRCQESGATAYMVKPVKKADLLQTIANTLHRLPAQTAPAKQVPVSDPAELRLDAGLKVLLAEDNVVNQKLAVHLLEGMGHKVVGAANGVEALERYYEQDFDLILMDVQMPELDGFATTGAIRANEARTGAHVPIIAMTAHALKGDRERCLAAGMDGYVPKPVDAVVLRTAIRIACRPAKENSPAPEPLASAGTPSALPQKSFIVYQQEPEL